MLPGADFKLKWPNDVFLADRKLAGVLIEVPSQSDGHAVIGVGLNVNNSFANAPEELSFTGISLSDQLDAKLNRVASRHQSGARRGAKRRCVEPF